MTSKTYTLTRPLSNPHTCTNGCICYQPIFDCKLLSKYRKNGVYLGCVKRLSAEKARKIGLFQSISLTSIPRTQRGLKRLQVRHIALMVSDNKSTNYLTITFPIVK